MARSKMRVHFSTANENWQTPPELFAAMHEDFDFDTDAAASAENALCPRFFTKEDDALGQDWGHGRIWVNPPYGRVVTGKFVEKAAMTARKGGTVVILLPARTDTKFFHDFVMREAREVRFIQGRLKFVGAKDSAPFPSMIVVFGSRWPGLVAPEFHSANRLGRAI